MKTIVKYPGSKWRLAEQIVSLFPKHHSYLEPFFGSGAVLFSKPRSNIETVNDLDGDVANLFQCIQKDPEKLSRMVYFTPFSRQIYDESYISIPSDPYEKAVWFLIRCNMGYGYRTNWIQSRLEEGCAGTGTGICRKRLEFASGQGI